MFGVFEEDAKNNSNSTININYMPGSIYKCISRKQFSIQRNNSNGSVSILQDFSKNGTHANQTLFGMNMKIGFKYGDVIGIAYLSKDMAMKCCEAFKSIIIDLKAAKMTHFQN